MTEIESFDLYNVERAKYAALEDMKTLVCQGSTNIPEISTSYMDVMYKYSELLFCICQLEDKLRDYIRKHPEC